jgi:hypothetical protein
MALTNYLIQSVSLVFLFFGVGLGLAGRVGIGVTTVPIGRQRRAHRTGDSGLERVE